MDTSVSPNNKSVAFGGKKKPSNAAEEAEAKRTGKPSGMPVAKNVEPAGEDETTSEARGRADHLLKRGLISPEKHAQLHADITAMAKAARPAIQGGGDPDAQAEREDSPHNKSEQDGQTPAGLKTP